MKNKIIILIVVVAIAAGIINGCSRPENSVDFYNKVIAENNLDPEIIESKNMDDNTAAENIIIEKIIGEVIDDAGNGVILNGKSENEYISYAGISGRAKGNIILTYIIHAPEGDFDRFDYIIDCKENTK